ncbi:MAG: rod shape-determining protein MreC [Bdellovibrio sp.]|nr:rod shape-determining protein MreC [Bdellovibrio sp.]
MALHIFQNEAQRYKAIINSIVLIAALVGVSQQSDTVSQQSVFEEFLADTLAPLQKVVNSTHRAVVTIIEDYMLNINARRENRQLTEQIGELHQKLFAMTELELENKRLKALLAFGEEMKIGRVLAQIVAWDANSDFKVMRVNKGLNDGVKLQATVVTAGGLVGYVYRLSQHYADILTILDSNNRVDGILQRTRSHGIVEGVSKDKCVMKYVARTEPVILNDIILTSGLGNIFPKGIKVGVVSRIERESYGITQAIEVTPAVNFGQLEEVIILVGPENETRRFEWEALDAAGAEKYR